MRYRRRPEYVEAVQFTDPQNPPPTIDRGQDGVFRLQTGGAVPHVIRVGQWVVTDEQGIVTRMSADNFHGMYEAAEE